MQTKRALRPSPWKRALGCGLLLYVLVYRLAALGAGEKLPLYEYKGYDTNGTLLVQGVLAMRVDETNRLQGDWTLRVLDRSDLPKFGPQDGSGKISGYIRGEYIFLNLNPDQLENNIYMEGTVDEAGLSKVTGKWGYYGFAGKVKEGNFELVKHKPPPPPPPPPSTNDSPQSEPPATAPPAKP